MKVLGIESSCDETGVAIYDLEAGLLAHALHSQIDLHAAYGGVVPELASRDHIVRLPALIVQTLREAVQGRNKIFIQYLDLSDKPSERTLRPLGCFYWGKVWTLSAWCELRNDFRGFRIDRIAAFKVLPERFRQEPGKTLADLLRQVEAERDGWPLECAAAPGADGRS